MREVVHVQVGQCGNQMGHHFWNAICREHGIDATGSYVGDSDLQLEHMEVYFSNEISGKHIPRAIMVDTEYDDSFARYPMYLNIPGMYRLENYFYGMDGCGNNWAKGFYTNGTEIIDAVMDGIRKEVESCESLDTFQMTHSIGGGTGSGLGSLIVDRLKEEYPSNLITTFTVVPSPKVSDIVVEPYNSVLSMKHLIEHAEQCFVFDNDALINMCLRERIISEVTYSAFSDLNHIICTAMTGITSFVRFPNHNKSNDTFSKLATNLIPFPKLHFLMPSISHVTRIGAENRTNFVRLSASEIINNIFSQDHCMCGVAGDMNCRVITTVCIVRERMNRNSEILYESFQNRVSKVDFLDGIPNNKSISLCDMPPPGMFNMHGTMISNSTAIQSLWRNELKKYSELFKRKAFLHWYTGEGMEMTEFLEAEENLNCLVSEYQEIENATVEMPFNNSSPDCC